MEGQLKQELDPTDIVEEEEEEEEEDNLRGGLEILFFLRETIVFSLLISFLCLS